MFSVELVGLPGAGKSTIAIELAKQINRGGRKLCYTSDEAFYLASKLHTDKLYRILLTISPKFISRFLAKKIHGRTIYQGDKSVDFLLRHYGCMKTIFNGQIFNEMSYCDKHTVISGVLHAGAIYEAICSNEAFDKVVLFDEGFIQSSLVMGSPGDLRYDINELIQYVNYIPLPNLIIYLKSNVDTCCERMLKREKGITKRLRKLDRQQLATSLSIMDAIIHQLIGFFAEKNVAIVEVDSGESLNDTVLAISDSILPFINRFCQEKKTT